MEKPEGTIRSWFASQSFTRRQLLTVAVAATTVVVAVGGYALGMAQADSSHNTTGSPDVEPTATVSRSTAPNSSGPPTTGSTPPESTTSTSAATTEPPPTSAATPKEPEYAFPIQPAAGVAYDPSHHDYPAADMFAECGTEVVAPHAGVIQDVSHQDRWSSSHDTPRLQGGLSFSIVGDDGVRYYGSHLESIDPAVRPGARVATRQRIGTVGDTGNAKGTGCHLHFGISTPCGPGDVLRRRGRVLAAGLPRRMARGHTGVTGRSPRPISLLTQGRTHEPI
ncbi:MAG: M23 family metallopeptidase [Microthrixaceae bacterium]|nr:M23 family metallopeptidase [Microthrixaceae bacterium]